MNATERQMGAIGPLELLYSGAEQILSAAQGAVHLHKVSDFIESVRWQEPFIRAIIGGQVLLFLFTYATRKRDWVQFGILFCITLVALSAESLNNYGKLNWKRFASQDYFDRSGLFMLTFVSGPFVILANFIVIGMGLRLVKLYARRKRRELLTRQRQASGSGREDDKKDN